jgi:type VI secretion system protein
VFLTLSGCGVTASVSNFFVGKESRLNWSGLTVIADEGANLNTALAVDVVLVRDESALAAVMAISASRWFRSRTDLVKTYPETLQYVSVELAPGQTMKLPTDQLKTERVLGAVVFADYIPAGEHRMRVEQLAGDIVVQLGARSFDVVSVQRR